MYSREDVELALEGLAEGMSVREVCEKVASRGEREGHILNLAKGIEISTGDLLHKVYAECCPFLKYSALSGPSHAEEVLVGRPTTVALASVDEDEARGWQEIVSGNKFRVYTGTDVIGLDVGGATKNIYAVAAGIAMYALKREQFTIVPLNDITMKGSCFMGLS